MLQFFKDLAIVVAGIKELTVLLKADTPFIIKVDLWINDQKIVLPAPTV